MYKPNDLVLRTTTSLIAFILLGFAIYLLLAGHNSPGGGFVGGLLTSGAILLMYMAYGMEVVKKIIPINFTLLIPIGLSFAVGTGLGSFIFNVPFLSQTFGYFYLPIFGEIELATAMIFDIGVYFTVVGVMMTIILTIANDQ
ncbi:Na(+)/H(+) antiporter subunit B [Virgibacillus halodenitrificans]|uniref:Na(+)/H(+) antiporter subunit B n=1 Tax=Virgibacillus halodenitrificans TaxID=1482 RepID=A0ABR7VV03_VIRHA|nr:Na(+)/H(+) antiporter subunit B [Virgibacillus halodenitrificans]MBD1224284.1 Na(+)/H(+) antiporter subunit B [Virgibacillus halodenitrificans]MCG1028409.1 Na(+)/H(+) antiporter subunit B [Virgibacillus halodenitrificans]MCJ0931111.1 Na(+)/H(+) antiporter subunit B [Virgibacillus halodenitrificans]MEC2160941.1 Na(+)/H(+) antiporter subunit B [Virgibacillus halodenitrificans]MYL45366.1 Na(+)/H(+) antiporter subunit B [Virgibacillus halodenitrificans]